ncbi:hypothetical protein B9Z55_006057 [Caenorhabditis nigoni]|uniref:F-box associated domain-containing protein n=3 Tax=Caenorhabditis nigoni TaxID=1611254 RepID=A0A2G5V3J8_9PELO|nr:hypothetical protein B9Z55_006057 [Caenorhabditis nigoni]
MLSFVSKNMKKMIKSSQLQRFKISIQLSMTETFTYAQKKEAENKNKANNTDGVSLYVSGYIIDFHLIGDSMEYHWKTNHYSSSIPQLQNLSACILFNIHFNMRKNAADEKTIERLFSSSPSLKYAHMSFIDIPLSPESESKLYQAESIKISQLTPMTPAVLYNFQGRQAIIRCFRCHFSNLIEFLNRWKSGEAYHKLEYLKIETFNLEAFEDDILNAIGAKRIDSQKPPVTHTLPRRFIEYTSQTKTDPIITHSYVVRESDNRVASVLIEERALSFGVWNKTEEEFLRMME